MKETNTRIKT